MDRFSGKLVLVLLDDKTHGSIKDGRSLWGIHEGLTYQTSIGGEGTITVPPGFVTDLASIPRLASSIYPPDGPWVKAAIIHDYLYGTAGVGIWKTHGPSISRATPYTRAEADDVLREAMENRGVGIVKRNVIWSAVRVGGAAGWGS
jgi:hypothetical protein